MGKKPIEAFTSNTILRSAMLVRGEKQVSLSSKMGIQQASLSGNLNRTRMGLDVFVKILDVMDYDVVVIDRTTGEEKWKVAK